MGQPLWRAVYVLSHFSHVWLFTTPMDCSPPGSSVHEVSQVRILEWVAIPSLRESSQARNQTRLLRCRQILYHEATREVLWRRVWRFLKKLKIELTYDPAILLSPGHISGQNYNLKRYMLPSVNWSTAWRAMTWKQSKCPSAAEWLK